MKKIIGRIVLIIAIIGLVYSGYKLFLIFNDYNKNANVYNELKDYIWEVSWYEGVLDFIAGIGIELIKNNQVYCYGKATGDTITIVEGAYVIEKATENYDRQNSEVKLW